MFRLVVGVLAAFVGFSFGHSIPKWMENNKTKSATESSSSGSAPSARKLLLRRKSLRKFKFGFQKSGKENLEADESLQKLSKPIAECNGPPSSSLGTSMRVRTEQKKLKFGSPKVMKEKMNHEIGHKVSHVADLCAKSEIGHKVTHVADGLPAKSKLEEPVFCKISSTQKSTCGLPPVKEKTQMKQWKMKLMSLRTKAMASEKAWYEKFENERRSPDPLVLSSKGVAKKQAKGKENESPQWSRSSSSKLRLLVEGPKTAFER